MDLNYLLYIINKTYFWSMELKRLVALLVFVLSFWVGCVPPMYEPPAAQQNTLNPDWENTGNISASFISTSRTVGVNTNTGSPSFNVSFIASASNIDSLEWSFPGGITNDTISEVTESVEYAAYGRYDVGLKVYNTEDSDSRYYEDFIEIYYKDDLSFGENDPAVWSKTGTETLLTDFTHPVDAEGNPYQNWAIVPFSSAHAVAARKSFEDFPKNNLILEFDYKLERQSVIYVDGASITGTSLSSPTVVDYVNAVDATADDLRIDSPTVYPGAKRFSIEYDSIPLWIASRINDEFFEHVRLELPSQSNFTIRMVKEPQAMLTKLIPFDLDPTATNTTTPVADTSTATPSDDTDGDGVTNLVDVFPFDPNEQFDTDGDGYGNTADNDDDGDGYLDTTETAANSDPLDRNSIPKYVIQHVHYPYNLNIRNLTIKIKEED